MQNMQNMQDMQNRYSATERTTALWAVFGYVYIRNIISMDLTKRSDFFS